MIRISSGIKGLDHILNGGFFSKKIYLIKGGPGCGKTTMGLHFIQEGLNNGETTLYICLEETKQSIFENNKHRPFALDQIVFLDLSPKFVSVENNENYDIFFPNEVEVHPLFSKIKNMVKTIKPSRIVIDPITIFRWLIADQYLFRKEIIMLFRYLLENNATVMIISEAFSNSADDDLSFLSDGVITINKNKQDQSVVISKLRGSSYHWGNHSLKISSMGINIFPILIPQVQDRQIDFERYSSGIEKLDNLFGGGLDHPTITVLSGPSGIGKTTVSMQFISNNASQGKHCDVYSFEENIQMIKERCKNLHIPVFDTDNKNTMHMFKIEPLALTSHEFSNLVIDNIKKHNSKIVVLDSVAGYKLALKDSLLHETLHALLKMVQSLNVSVLLISEKNEMKGLNKITDDNLSFLADNLIYMEYVEVDGFIRKTIGVLKKRLGDFEKRTRIIEFSSDKGIVVKNPVIGIVNPATKSNIE